MIKIDDYRTGEYPFPRHEIDPKKKNDEWLKQFCQAMYSAWLRDKTAVPYSELNEYERLRKYGAGKQDPETYQDILLGDQDSEDSKEREGWLNIDWDIFSPAVKFKNVVIGMMTSQGHDVTATAIDPTSGKERDEKKWQMWFEAQYKNDINYVDRNLGVKRDKEAFLPETLQELQIFEELGGFKLKKEFSMEKGIEYTLYISDWKQIESKLYNDLLDINICASKDYVDQHTQKVRCRYVNPSRLVIQYSRHHDHRNSEWAGEIIPMKILDIRKNAPHIKEEELRELALMYQGINRNARLPNWDTEQLLHEDGRYRYDDFWVDVFDAEIRSVDITYKEKRKNQRGEERYYTGEWGKTYTEESQRQTKIIKGQTVYRAKWIIGTDMMFDTGHQFDIPRPGKKEVALSYHAYRMEGRSIISLIQPNLDQIQLTWLKLQNAIAMAAPTGIAVEFSALQNMVIGGKTMEPLEILEIRRGVGDVVYRATTHRGYVNSPHAGKPIQELEGGLGRSLDEYIRLFELNFGLIRDLTGINEIADATTPDPNQPVGTSKMAVAATNNALKPLYNGYISVLEKMARNIALRLQILVKHSKRAYDVYYPVIGRSSLQALSIGAEILDSDMHIKIELLPTQEQLTDLINAAQEATKADKDGFVGLEYGDYLIVAHLARTGNIRLAQAVMGQRSKENKALARQQQQENMELNAKTAQATDTNKAQLESQKKAQENELKKDFETHKTNEQIRLQDKKHADKLEEIAAEKVAEAAINEQTAAQTQTIESSNNNQNS